MPNKTLQIIALDVGEKRIGVAAADTSIRIAFPYRTIKVDGSEIDQLRALLNETKAELIVIGYPRNQKGEETAQTEYVKDFTKTLKPLGLDVKYQDESLTSVLAEERLKAQNRPYAKEDIDAHAAAIILNDYLESHYAARF